MSPVRRAVRVAGQWKLQNGRLLVPATPGPVWPQLFTTDNSAPAWKLKAGESLLDNVPANVPIVDASDYLPNSTDLPAILREVAARVSSGVYVRLDAYSRYFINELTEVNPNNYVGFHNGTSGRRIMGLIGRGPEATSVCMSPTAVSNTPGARDFALAATKNTGPVPITALYFSGLNQSVPLFITGISFDGQLQGPFGVYNTTVQAQFNRNQGVASPLPWRGISIWRSIAGARVQFNRFQGFGYSLLNAPPFEMGPIDTNYSDGLLFYRDQWDGRIAAEFDPARPRAAGGLMWNKDIRVTVRDSHLHHTRRSGWATNTNTGRTDERYTGENFQMHDITGTDGYASGGGFFPGTNIEAVLGVMTYRMVTMTTGSEQHAYLAVPFSGSPGQYGNLMLDRPIIDLEGFRTFDTVYGGCFRVGVPKQPNSTGISPAWQRITDRGIAGSNLFDVRAADGTPLVGVKSTSFNASAHKPTTHFVVTY